MIKKGDIVTFNLSRPGTNDKVKLKGRVLNIKDQFGKMYQVEATTSEHVWVRNVKKSK